MPEHIRHLVLGFVGTQSFVICPVRILVVTMYHPCDICNWHASGAMVSVPCLLSSLARMIHEGLCAATHHMSQLTVANLGMNYSQTRTPNIKDTSHIYPDPESVLGRGSDKQEIMQHNIRRFRRFRWIEVALSGYRLSWL